MHLYTLSWAFTNQYHKLSNTCPDSLMLAECKNAARQPCLFRLIMILTMDGVSAVMYNARDNQ